MRQDKAHFFLFSFLIWDRRRKNSQALFIYSAPLPMLLFYLKVPVCVILNCFSPSAFSAFFVTQKNRI
ncbi:hypothetical protein [Aggregatibacter actinomycetemcomitans]|uniref:hypothetical protein n=1 Tax=Aggregatibacter actinomycetemcomitans TaxID=714 RepID=UPI0002AC5ED0|nr:hypothetical protein [Aggregatibacter actinomycetemcomitans]